MIQIIGLVVVVYVCTRAISGVSTNPQGGETRPGRIAWGVCFILTAFLGVALLMTTAR
jgi:hypothetical protein